MKRNKFEERKNYKERPIVQEDIDREFTALGLITLIAAIVIAVYIFFFM